ncbi:WD40/YVTN/BNR-like repeat-containing protein [Acidocella aquatica]|nr:YCF48-related protein [Acidocella aquatica]
MLISTPLRADGQVPTGIRPLDTPALAAKVPDQVTLIAITKAGNRLVAVGEHGVIIYSDDNGKTWTQARVPVSVLLTAVAFATPAQGWAVGHYGVILHTSDAGATWQLQLNGIQANQLTLDAANQAVAQDPNSEVAQRALHRANIFMAAGADKPFLTVLALSANDAIAFGGYRMAMRTTDGGKTWTDWSLHIGDPISHNLYDVEQIGPYIVIAGEAGNVFISTDGGNDFPAVTAPTDATMFGAVATGDNNGVLVFGVAGQAYRSEDGGKTWQTVQTFGSEANLLAARTLASGVIVVVSEAGVIYVSRDHAHSFTRLPEPQKMGLFDLVQAANGDVVFVGNLGVQRVPAQDFGVN